jgi:glycosyltransferase involved in cell wall biosynthesis
MKIAFWGMNSSTDYSGGRYHAWMMAEALASRGHSVSFFTNTEPIFITDFLPYPRHESIRILLLNGLRMEGLCEQFDIVVIVPHLAYTDSFFGAARQFARQTHAKLVLLNFETGNWVNEVSPFKRDIALWNNWINVCDDGCMVLSISAIGQEYAKKFFVRALEKTSFAYSYPAINNLIADSVHVDRKEERIVMLARFSDQHKGGHAISRLLCPEMEGHVLSIIVGNRKMMFLDRKRIINEVRKAGATVEFHFSLSDREKFAEIKKAKLLLFPSYFEGFGYPPVEARYCGTHCIAFDLPVLREVNGNEVEYVPLGDVEKFQAAIAEHLRQPKRLGIKADGIQTFDSFAEKVDRIFTDYHLQRAIDNSTKSCLSGELPIQYDAFLAEVFEITQKENMARASIYGAGKNGQLLYGALVSLGIKIEKVIDDNQEGTLGQHSICRLSAENPDIPVFVSISALNQEGRSQIVSKLKAAGVKHLIYP